MGAGLMNLGLVAKARVFFCCVAIDIEMVHLWSMAHSRATRLCPVTSSTSRESLMGFSEAPRVFFYICQCDSSPLG